MKSIMFLICIIITSNTYAKYEIKKQIDKENKTIEVVENPTLKTLSGSLNKWSFYSSHVYRGGSLSRPTSAERPNILKAQEQPSLASANSNIGLKFRSSHNDNFSLQIGVYSTTPFHSELKTSNTKNQKDFDKNHQKIDFDDPTLSYFRTFYLGSLQNISFLKYQFVTRGIYRDYGLKSVMSYSQASAYKLNKFSYIAGSLTYEYYNYDKEFSLYKGRKISLLPYQTEHKLRANISAEMYIRKNVSLRFITDIFSIYKMKEENDFEKRGLQQTIAFTYFFNRDISIAPNFKFVAKDIRKDRTNIGLTLNVNL